jgi:hypothetical protein
MALANGGRESLPHHFGTVPERNANLGKTRRSLTPLPGVEADTLAALRNNIRDQIILHHRDLVAQFQLALFQAGDLQLVGRSGASQRIDRGVQIAVFGPQQVQPLAQLFFIHVLILQTSGLPLAQSVLSQGRIKVLRKLTLICFDDNRSARWISSREAVGPAARGG